MKLVGERIFPKLSIVEPRLAGKVIGMLIELDQAQLLVLANDSNACYKKIIQLANQVINWFKDMWKEQWINFV